MTQISNPWPFAPEGVSDTDCPVLAIQSILRSDIRADVVAASGQMYLTYFRAQRNRPLATARAYSGATAAAATPTLVRFGLYLENPDRSLTLVAAIANDTAIFATINTEYSRALTTGLGYAPIEGARYASGILTVTGAAAPSILGAGAVGSAVVNAYSPRTNGIVTGLTDLPATIADATVANAANRQYVAFGIQ